MNATDGAIVHHCYVFAVRYSSTLLHRLASHHVAGHWGYLELEAPTLCYDSIDANCTMGDFLSTSNKHSAIGDPFNAVNMHYISELDLGYVPNASTTQLFHKVIK